MMTEESKCSYHVDRERPDAKAARHASKQFVQLCDHGDCESIHYLAAALLYTDHGLSLLLKSVSFRECDEQERFQFVGERLMHAKPRGDFEAQRPTETPEWLSVLNRAAEISRKFGSVISGHHGLLAALDVEKVENDRFLEILEIERLVAIGETAALISFEAG